MGCCLHKFSGSGSSRTEALADLKQDMINGCRNVKLNTSSMDDMPPIEFVYKDMKYITFVHLVKYNYTWYAYVL
jgi:hypothetical protein